MTLNRDRWSEVVEPHCECGTRDQGAFNVARGRGAAVKNLPDDLIGAAISDGRQMRAATRDLRSAIQGYPALASAFNENQLLAIKRGLKKIPDLTWHHHEDGRRLQLVDQVIHAKTPHIGGRFMTGGRKRR